MPFTVTGPTCDSADTMFYGAPLPVTMAEGDRLYVASAGAYTLSYASSFNGFPPPHAVTVGSARGLGADPRKQRRLRWLMIAGWIDSLCLSFAWTLLLLEVVERHGLRAAGVAGAAMLVGTAMSAPVASQLSVWLGGRHLLRTPGRPRQCSGSASSGCCSSTPGVAARRCASRR